MHHCCQGEEKTHLSYTLLVDDDLFQLGILAVRLLDALDDRLEALLIFLDGALAHTIAGPRAPRIERIMLVFSRNIKQSYR